MVRKRSVIGGRRIDERRFRFRARFERPPGGGAWFMEDNLLKWLNARVGKDDYAFHGEDWEGHGSNCYALYFDDHTIIPDLLEYYATIETVLTRPTIFVGQIERAAVTETRDAIRRMQETMVGKLNSAEERVVWALGRCESLHLRGKTEGERVMIERINDLTTVVSLLCNSSSEDPVKFELEDRLRGSLEIGFAILRDRDPQASEFINPIRNLLDSLVEDTREYDVRSGSARERL